jgi:outer membrane protein assembly factor BamB
MSPKFGTILLLLLLPAVVSPQQPEATPEPPISVLLPTDAKWERRLAVAQDYIDEKDWQRAVALLQSALDGLNDSIVNVKRRIEVGPDITVRVSLHDEAERMLRALPAEGLAYYKSANNAAAANLLAEAKAKSSPDLFGMIVKRYFVTDSGPEALELLAEHETLLGYPPLARSLKPEESGYAPPDLAHLMRAAQAFDKLVAFRGSFDALSQDLLFKAAIAYTSVGNKGKADRIWKVVDLKVAKEGLYLGHRRSVDQVRRLIETASTSPMIGGSPSRSAHQTGDVPYLGHVWEQSMFSEDTKGAVKKWITSATQFLEDRKQPALFASTPITAVADVPGKGRKRLVFYRSHWGLHAVDVKTGLMMWDADYPWSLEKMYMEPRTIQAVENWLQDYLKLGRLNVVLENSLIGSLTTDGRLVYSIDDLPVPPRFGQFFNAWTDPARLPWAAEVNDALRYNVLRAFEANNGRMRWSIGGRGERLGFNDPKGELNDSYFLGPPFPLGGRLYAIHEKAKELRLAILDPRRGTIERIVPLAKLRDSLLEDSFRRLHAAHAAFGDGVLVCPTNAGALIGVDLAARTPIWAYIYRHDKESPIAASDGGGFRVPGRELPRDLAASLGLDGWMNSAPVVVNSKVVFTAPDAPSIHCINIKDGSVVWKTAKKPGDLYFAGVYADKVLVVGKEKCRALNLSGGQEAWSIDSLMPSGRGIAADGKYYLPLKSSAGKNEPEICVIDIARGSIVAHARVPQLPMQNVEPPGNLLFFEDRLLSQSSTRVVAYPLLGAKLKEMEEKLKANPLDPATLLESGELRLGRGDWSKAVQDLRAVLTSKPDEKTRDRARLVLFEALTGLLQKDFNAPEKDLKEYEELTQIEGPKTRQATIEAQRRRGIFVTIVGLGHEQAGELVEALRLYLDFAATAPATQLLPVAADPNVRVAPDAWARGHIVALLKRATPEQRKQLEEEIEKRLKK